jgi:hypothetical protein
LCTVTASKCSSGEGILFCIGFRKHSGIYGEETAFAWMEIYSFIASKCFLVQGTAKIRHVLQAGTINNAELILEAVENRKYFTIRNCLVRKRKCIIFLSKDFNSSLNILTN